MRTHKYIDIKKNSNVDYKYFVYINTNVDVIGLDRLSEENLQKVIDAFAYGHESFLITGRRYFFNEPLEFRIFKIDVNLHPNFSIIQPGSKRMVKRFYTPDYLITKGEEVTDDFIKGDFGWKAEVRPLSSGYFQVIGKTEEVSIGLEPSKIVQDKINAEMKNENVTKNMKHQSNKVFIVHGHDNGAKEATARFIERLGLEAIILHEQINGGRTIIEKLEKYTDVGYAVVLYTPCDVGGLNEPKPELKARARQNVVFEHGLLVGKLGRQNVMTLVKGDVERPGDTLGEVYYLMDENGAWRKSLLKELQEVGFIIDPRKALDAL